MPVGETVTVAVMTAGGVAVNVNVGVGESSPVGVGIGVRVGRKVGVAWRSGAAVTGESQRFKSGTPAHIRISRNNVASTGSQDRLIALPPHLHTVQDVPGPWQNLLPKATAHLPVQRT